MRGFSAINVEIRSFHGAITGGPDTRPQKGTLSKPRFLRQNRHLADNFFRTCQHAPVPHHSPSLATPGGKTVDETREGLVLAVELG